MIGSYVNPEDDISTSYISRTNYIIVLKCSPTIETRCILVRNFVAGTFKQQVNHMRTVDNFFTILYGKAVSALLISIISTGIVARQVKWLCHFCFLQ
ncbi:hypothetical protein BZL43_18350 [Pseudomonas sp. PICF141]|nr:hypothetical protein BZL43_18350 [Pseudomonas sp. PICF141]